MQNHVQPGEFVTVAAPAQVASGDIVVVGNLVGVAAGAAQETQPVEIALGGVYRLPKASAANIGVGDKLYLDEGAGELVNAQTTEAEPYVGTATKAAGSGVTTVECLLGYHARS